ncbi:NAD(P)-dependent oxidoreductase [Ruegeria sp. HKCCD8929]|uniref:NAD(P)-dependent oxidoreductase n=1 Tax=Ruegeria sp. HKCCD8929 TaxID=2683006 RepID=UPI002112443E|nr:NAD(P)-dependent oxidoreductase [Ruegeria sp. HKCCD8929]
MKSRIGWIGLGKMGVPMALNLCGAGADVTVFNRSREKSRPLCDAGANLAPNASVLAAQSDVLFTMLSDDAALRQVLLGDTGALKEMRKGAILVDMSTVSPTVSSEVAEIANTFGLRYLRSPVSGSVALAESGALTVMASGPIGAFEEVRSILGALSARQFHVGDQEQARVLKLSINMMVGFTAAMIGEALALGLKNGLDRTTMLDVIGASAVASPLVGYKLDALKAQDYTPAFEVTQMAKDFDLILEAGRKSAVPMPMAAQMREGWSELIADGDAEQDFFKYVELATRRAGMRFDDRRETAA